MKFMHPPVHRLKTYVDALPYVYRDMTVDVGVSATTGALFVVEINTPPYLLAGIRGPLDLTQPYGDVVVVDTA